MSVLERIVFVHDGKANYPSIAANRVLFEPYFEIAEMDAETAAADARIATSIGWQMMGFYPKRLPCALLVHDYKSLSLGRFCRQKDWLKRTFNARPDLRIVKEPMLAVYGFDDGVPHVLQDIGVNDDLKRHIRPPKVKTYDFCYVGAMTRERKFDRMLHAFLASPVGSQSFVLVGQAEPELRAMFADRPNLIFTGRLSQPEVYTMVQAARVSVCYFPNHYPHTIQTPTKLLEAAALGARIVMNDQPMNRAIADRYGIAAHMAPLEVMFENLPAADAWPDNHATAKEPLYWSHMVKASGLAEALAQAAAAKGLHLPEDFVRDYGGKA